jgi:hypothetical protein
MATILRVSIKRQFPEQLKGRQVVGREKSVVVMLDGVHSVGFVCACVCVCVCACVCARERVRALPSR